MDIEKLKEGIKEFYDIDPKDTSWIEGWICGYTDGDHKIENSDQVHDELLDYLKELRGD